jgi:hypothetical protein
MFATLREALTGWRSSSDEITRIRSASLRKYQAGTLVLAVKAASKVPAFFIPEFVP